MSRIKVAVLGATGAVGQRFVQLLENHPWFEVTALTGPDRSAGQLYSEACRWILDRPMPEYARASWRRYASTKQTFCAKAGAADMRATQPRIVRGICKGI